MILPSILEYSSQSLVKKLDILYTQKKFIKSIIDPENKTALPIHLDLVYTQFAKDRSVMTSLELDKILKIIQNHPIKNCKLDLSVHFMAELEDYNSVFSSINKSLPFWPRKNSQVTFFIPKKANLASWIEIMEWTPENLNWGNWYDLNQWNGRTEFLLDNNLLMTVFAGRSGQKLESSKLIEIENLRYRPDLVSLNKSKDNKEKSNFNLIIDGGIDFDLYSKLAKDMNLNAVMYSAFWKKFDLLK